VENPNSDEKYLSLAIQLAIGNVHDSGGPFAALLVTTDGQEFTGVNRVTANNDPTSTRVANPVLCASLPLSGRGLNASCSPPIGSTPQQPDSMTQSSMNSLPSPSKSDR